MKSEIKKIDNYNRILDDNFIKHLPKNNENNEKKLLNTLELKQSKDSNDIMIKLKMNLNFYQKKMKINIKTSINLIMMKI